jgi:hypothetical protein
MTECTPRVLRPCRRRGTLGGVASYHFHAGFIGRSSGRSVVAGSAYLAREKLRDERSGIEHDYRRAHEGDRVHAEVLAPEGAPAWARNREALWNRVEATEDTLAASRFRSPEGQARAIGQARTAYSIRAALPRELPPEAQVEVARSFFEETFVSRGLVVDFAVHSDPGNPHLHAQVTLRAVDGDRFSPRKERVLFQKPGLFSQREAFARAQNEALRDHGHDARVDARSFAAAGSPSRRARTRGIMSTEPRMPPSGRGSAPRTSPSPSATPSSRSHSPRR